MRRAISCLLALLAVACATPPAPRIERAPQSEALEDAKTYGFRTQQSPSDPAFGTEARQTAEAAIGATLADRGLEPADGAHADLLVTVHTDLEENAEAAPLSTRIVTIDVHTPDAAEPLWSASTPLGEELDLGRLRRSVSEATEHFPANQQ